MTIAFGRVPNEYDFIQATWTITSRLFAVQIWEVWDSLGSRRTHPSVTSMCFLIFANQILSSSVTGGRLSGVK